MFESSQQVIVGIYQYKIYDHMCDVCSHGTYAKSVYSVITFIVSVYQHLNWKRNDVALSPSQWGSILRVWIFWASARSPKYKSTHMCPDLTQPITVAIESHHYSQQTDIFRHQMNVSFLPNQLRRFINHHLRVVSHLIIWFRYLLSQHHLLCAVKINPTCDIWGKDLTKDGEGSTWDTLCRARYTDLA